MKSREKKSFSRKEQDDTIKSVVKSLKKALYIFDHYYDESGRSIFDPESVIRARRVFTEVINNGERSMTRKRANK